MKGRSSILTGKVGHSNLRENSCPIAAAVVDLGALRPADVGAEAGVKADPAQVRSQKLLIVLPSFNKVVEQLT